MDVRSPRGEVTTRPLSKSLDEDTEELKEYFLP
jgi:hypothetical protein